MSDIPYQEAFEGLTLESIWVLFRETFEEIRAMQRKTDGQLQETDREIKETHRELKEEIRELRESIRETSEQIKKTDEQMKKTDEQMKKTDKLVGDMTNRFGELAEHMVGPSIMQKFNDLGFSLNKLSRNIEIKDLQGNPLAEVDILMEGEDCSIVVEIKAAPRLKHVEAHIKRLKILRQEADRKGQSVRYLGALAGALMDDEVKAAAMEEGFYVIEQAGDSVFINNPPGFKPSEW